MPRHHMVDGVQVPFTAAEEIARNAEEVAEEAAKPARAMASLRTKRDHLLNDTDWWASSDLSITEAQTSYRQALRDLPANTADPTNITWPEKP